MIGFLAFIFLFVLNRSNAGLVPQATGSPTTSASRPNSTVCGDIVKAKTQHFFNASTVYECLTSVPFNPTVASRFIRYYNDTLQFQSTITILKNPPASYRQPATDLIAGLARIQQAIDSEYFKNQYSFEAALQKLIHSAHDAHLQLVAGVLAPFKFGLPFSIASISLDGKALPKVYVTHDLSTNETETITWRPSAISKINGRNATDYLTQFAADNSIGGLEPHADWNMLMKSPALDIQGIYEVLAGGTTFYPGDTYTITFENGTTLGPRPWLALYTSPGDTGSLRTGEDFYNFFVLGLYPASHFEQLEASSTPAATNNFTSTQTPTSWNNPAYPDHPDVVQYDFAVTGGGFLSGYFLHDTSVAVLSISSFTEYGNAIETFSSMIDEFISKSRKNRLNKVVIDVQQNSGGDVFLAIDAFQKFFPSFEPFVGSRRRIHPMANVLGDTISRFWKNPPRNTTGYSTLTDDEWVILTRLSAATGKNFSSWGEYFDPTFMYKDDAFSATELYNLSNFLFDSEASGVNATSPPYKPEDIIILTDGLCSSSCAVFMELMHHEAGVRTVVAGGRPNYGPMQSPAQSRGARSYDTNLLSNAIEFARAVNDTARTLLPNQTLNRDLYITSASVNLRDQVRQNQSIPLQFLYEAANCRIFFTPQTWYNYSALWRYAANAIWTDPALCVQGSTGYATAPERPSGIGPDPNIQQYKPKNVRPSDMPGEDPAISVETIIPDTSRPIDNLQGTPCSMLSEHSGHLVCYGVGSCDSNGRFTEVLRWIHTCFRKTDGSYWGCTSDDTYCYKIESWVDSEKQNHHLGYCIPFDPICHPSVPGDFEADVPPTHYEDYDFRRRV